MAVQVIDVSGYQAQASSWMGIAIFAIIITIIIGVVLVLYWWRLHKIKMFIDKIRSIYNDPEATMAFIGRADGSMIIEDCDYIANYLTPRDRKSTFLMSIPKQFNMYGIPTALCFDFWDVTVNPAVLEATIIKIEKHNNDCINPDIDWLTEEDIIYDTTDMARMIAEKKLDTSDIILPPFAVVTFDKIMKYFDAVPSAVVEGHFTRRKELDKEMDNNDVWKKVKFSLLICAGLVIVGGVIFAFLVTTGAGA